MPDWSPAAEWILARWQRDARTRMDAAAVEAAVPRLRAAAEERATGATVVGAHVMAALRAADLEPLPQRRRHVGEGTVYTTVRITRALWERADAAARTERTSLVVVVEQALSEWLDRRGR
jgi:hypothetical protein